MSSFHVTSIQYATTIDTNHSCRYEKMIPTGTFAEPEEVAHAVSMLVQDLACNINGADIRLDGGFTVR